MIPACIFRSGMTLFLAGRAGRQRHGAMTHARSAGEHREGGGVGRMAITASHAIPCTPPAVRSSLTVKRGLGRVVVRRGPIPRDGIRGRRRRQLAAQIRCVCGCAAAAEPRQNSCNSDERSAREQCAHRNSVADPAMRQIHRGAHELPRIRPHPAWTRLAAPHLRPTLPVAWEGVARKMQP